jgi:hypothetical protein
LNEGVRGLGRKIARAWDEAGVRGIAQGAQRWARVRKLASLDSEEEYRLWLEKHFTSEAAPPKAAPTPGTHPLVLVFTRGMRDADLTRTRESLAGTRLPPGDVHPLAEADPLPSSGGAQWVTAVAAGDRFLPLALPRLAEALASGKNAATIVYADEDLLGTEGRRCRPFLKPAWSPLLSLTLPGLYPGAPAAISGALWDEIVAETKGRLTWSEAILIATERAAHVAHLPLPLLTRRARGGDDPLLGDPAARAEAAERARERRGLPGRLVPGEAPESLRLAPEAGSPPPSISILVPTRDRPEFLLPLGEVLERERERLGCELVLLDHETRDPRAHDYLDSLAARGIARVLPCSGPFNFARMINRGAAAAQGELLLLLNNDVLPQREGWLEALAQAALLPGVAAAGALLLYPDGLIQHAGIGLGIGIIAGHIHKGTAEGRTTPCVDPRVAREVSAVTGACLMIRREEFEAVGGLDEQSLAVSFNDVDLCLKLAARGRRILYEPAARLVHHETRTRVPEVDPRETRVMQERWGAQLAADPYLPPGLTRLTETPHLELWQRISPSVRA